MSQSSRVILLRFLRGIAALVVASAAAFAIGPEFLGIVPDQFDFIVVMVGAPALLALEKFLRDGGDARS